MGDAAFLGERKQQLTARAGLLGTLAPQAGESRWLGSMSEAAPLPNRDRRRKMKWTMLRPSDLAAKRVRACDSAPSPCPSQLSPPLTPPPPTPPKLKFIVEVNPPPTSRRSSRSRREVGQATHPRSAASKVNVATSLPLSVQASTQMLGTSAATDGFSITPAAGVPIEDLFAAQVDAMTSEDISKLWTDDHNSKQNYSS